jgi:hypothetical protein
MQLDAIQMKPLVGPLSGRYPACAICKKATLRSPSEVPKDAPSEIAVKLPCSHVFGQECINNYFKMLRPEDQLYNDRCPECNVLLYTQSTKAERYDRASEIKENGVYTCFWVIAITMFILCWVPVFSSVFAWQWVFLFGFLGIIAFAGSRMFKKHAEIRKELIDLEKGRSAEASTTDQDASPQNRMCDAEASTETGASLEKVEAPDERKTSHSDDDMTMVEHDEDEERAGLLSNEV